MERSVGHTRGGGMAPDPILRLPAFVSRHHAEDLVGSGIVSVARDQVLVDDEWEQLDGIRLNTMVHQCPFVPRITRKVTIA